MTMTAVVGSDQLHRHLKLALDTGEARSLFDSYRLGIVVGGSVAHSPTMQAAVLTAVNTGRRSFLGGVCVEGTLDVPLLVTWGRCRTLGEAVLDLQGTITRLRSRCSADRDRGRVRAACRCGVRCASDVRWLVWGCCTSGTKAFVFRSSKSAYPQVYWLGPLAFLKHFSSCVVITAWPDDEKSDCRYGIRTNPSTG